MRLSQNKLIRALSIFYTWQSVYKYEDPLIMAKAPQSAKTPNLHKSLLGFTVYPIFTKICMLPSF